MPEMRFDVRWPNGKTTRCYSPSSVVRELLQEQSYPLFEFVERARAALNIGAERVRVKFGFYCSAASEQLTQIEGLAREFSRDAEVVVTGLYAAGEAMPAVAEPNKSLDESAREVNQ